MNLQPALISLLVSCLEEGQPRLNNALDYARGELKDAGCPQCGQLYNERACGPTHAVIKQAIFPAPVPTKENPPSDSEILDILKGQDKENNLTAERLAYNTHIQARAAEMTTLEIERTGARTGVHDELIVEVSSVSPMLRRVTKALRDLLTVNRSVFDLAVANGWEAVHEVERMDK